MARFSQTIQSKYGVSTYQETKNTYDWLIKAIHSLEYSDLEMIEDFLFNIGEIGCSCDNITEFINNAYGQENYSLISLSLFLQFEDKECIHISLDSDGTVRVSARSKALLSALVEKLNSINLISTEINDPISVAYIENQNNGIVVQGNNNSVATAGSKIEEPPKTPKWKQFFEAVIQNLVANALGYFIIAALSVVLSALITLLAIKR